jgi:hypothetical protein
MRHEIPEEPARRGSHTSAPLCLDGATEKYGCITPRTKSARPLNVRKSWQHFEHLRTAMGRTPVDFECASTMRREMDVAECY